MNERIKFIADYLNDEMSFTELCEAYAISRMTGYKWVERYENGGAEELKDRSRRPHNHPNQVDQAIVDRILTMRNRHKRWGPKKLIAKIQRQEPSLKLPAASTVAEILKRAGMINARTRRRVSSPYANRLDGYDQSNSVWCADFKGHFPVGDDRCHPLTITDGFSRYILKCKGLPRPLHANVQREFEKTFKEYGLPLAIRTDNGPPFSTLAPGGLSRLSVWWIKLGIKPERIKPGRPDQNGRHERMHSTLKAETAKPPKGSMRSQQKAFDSFVLEFNTDRPHEALGMKVPDEVYRPSLREYPNRLPEIEYPSHYRVEKLYPNGVISVDQTQWYISHCLRNEFIGLEEVDNDIWKVYFGHVALGILDATNTHQLKNRRSFGSLIRLDGEVTQYYKGKRRGKV